MTCHYLKAHKVKVTQKNKVIPKFQPSLSRSESLRPLENNDLSLSEST